MNYFSPLDQFDIKGLLSIGGAIIGNLNLSITNIGLYLSISTIIIIFMALLTNNANKIVSNK